MKHFYKNIFLILTFLVFVPKFSYSEIIKKIEISGNERISSETIKMFTKKNIGENIEDKDLNEIFPGDINGEITDDFEDGCGCEESYECENNCCGEREEDINVENLDIKKLDAHNHTYWFIMLFSLCI